MSEVKEAQLEKLIKRLSRDPEMVDQVLNFTRLSEELRHNRFDGSITFHVRSGLVRKMKKEEWESWDVTSSQ